MFYYRSWYVVDLELLVSGLWLDDDLLQVQELAMAFVLK